MSPAFATGADSTKQKTALNDPRNPLCPCHAYQQQAEKEYHDILLKQHNYTTDPLAALYEKGWQSSLSGKSRKAKRRVCTRRQMHSNPNQAGLHGGVKKGKPHYSVCFRWR
jgi:hypothetical protein